MARILWIFWDHLGGLTAQIPIAREMAARGHEVVALCTPRERDRFGALGLGFRPHVSMPSYDWTEQGQSPWDPRQFQRWFVESIPSQVADATQVLHSERFDLVITEPTFAGGGFAAEQAAVPWITCVPYLHDHVKPPPGAHAWWQLLRARFGLPPDPREHREAEWLLLSPNLNLVLGLPELVRPGNGDPRYVRRVGPILEDPPFGGELPSWLPNIGKDRPAILAANSTAWNRDADVIVTAAEALAEEDVDVIATVAAQHDLPQLPINVRVTGFVPHGLILPLVSAVICTAGYGLTTKAACMGKPMILVPRMAEANAVAAAAVAAGIAIRVQPNVLEARTLRRAALRILNEASFGENALRLSKAARRYDAVKTSAACIEAFLSSQQA